MSIVIDAHAENRGLHVQLMARVTAKPPKVPRVKVQTPKVAIPRVSKPKVGGK